MYTCPMHPEIEQETTGRCPKCSMQLILKNELESKPVMIHDSKDSGVLTWRSYLPLIVIVSLIFVVSAILSWNNYRAEAFSITDSIICFMTGFFITFAGFKLMDLKGFAEGYSTYDLIAQEWFGYGYVYPFIELAFGLVMLAGLHNPAILWAEVIVMGFSGIGVLIKLVKGEGVQCACLGTFLKVPLTKITVVENFGMAALALVLLFLL